jgi:hypothetical protein
MISMQQATGHIWPEIALRDLTGVVHGSAVGKAGPSLSQLIGCANTIMDAAGLRRTATGTRSWPTTSPDYPPPSHWPPHPPHRQPEHRPVAGHHRRSRHRRLGWQVHHPQGILLNEGTALLIIVNGLRLLRRNNVRCCQRPAREADGEVVVRRPAGQNSRCP